IKKTEFSLKKTKKNTASNLKLGGAITKKKKKKGIYSSLKDIQDSEQKQSERVCKNPHKYISQEVAFTDENHDTDNTHNGGENCVSRKKRKKRKDKSDSFLPLLDNLDNIHGVSGSPIALSDFRKRKKQNSWKIILTSREEEDTTENSGYTKETKKNRSKDVSSSTCENKQGCSHSVFEKHHPAQQEVDSEEEELSGKKTRKNFQDNNKVSKKKKKKSIHKEGEEATYSKVSLNNDSAYKSQKVIPLESNKRNKRKKTDRAECVSGDAGDGVLSNGNHMFCDRKGKKRKKLLPQDFAEEPGSKANTEKTKIKTDTRNESLEHLDGVIIVKEKKGNCDEVNIDKVRRQALQEEIDRESGKTKVFGSKLGQDTKFGQWSTAAFKSSKEEMKFFRLMGGFKKSSVPIQNLSATTNKPNMALNREGEEKLQQALKMEFDKAMDLRQHRGVGLGFQPTANKKVYIDKYTSRSIKFED
ncbi:KNOP1 protein, partial [Calyptomena viridis]|nr:KNOP1 protein [Calyptomena viridis]